VKDGKGENECKMKDGQSQDPIPHDSAMHENRIMMIYTPGFHLFLNISSPLLSSSLTQITTTTTISVYHQLDI
jgi:hypothetical protein